MNEAIEDALLFMGKAGKLEAQTIDEVIQVILDPAMTEDIRRVTWAFLEGRPQ